MSPSRPRGAGSGLPGARRSDPQQRPVAATGGVRRRPGWVWAGVGTVVVSAVGFVMVASAVGEREKVLVLARDVPVGHVLTADDLRQTEVASGTGVVLAADRARVLGQRAKVPLVGGSLLAPGQFGGARAFPPRGQSEVAFAIEVGNASPEVVRGDRVAVLEGPGGAAGRSGEEKEDVAPVVGTVTAAKTTGTPGGPRVVTVLVETGAVRRAAGLEHPRVVVLPAVGREAP
ncbi:SAF domain-containing protein [Streptomyces asiaticus]|uniref:SAF domain-containing protein n=1 Tax=Streptomyces asiaticus TaxID=114695 RepID=UPI003D71BE93